MTVEKITFFRNYYESLKEVPPEDFKTVISAMCEKAFYDHDVELTGHNKSLYLLIEPYLLKSIQISNLRSEQGKKGGAPKGNTNASKKKTTKNNQASTEDKENQTNKNKKENEKENKKEIENGSMEKDTSKRFTPPSLEEVCSYCRERNNNINPESFIDYYSSNGWKVGSSTMKDWKAAVRTWEHRDKNKDNMKQSHMMTNHYTSEDFVELEKKLLEN